MSRSFIGFGQKQYIGVPYVRPITLGGLLGQVAPLQFNWLSYGASSTVPNINVAVDLSVNLVASKLRQIRSVYIDNMGSDNPIYVYFPSTDYAVVAQPNSAGWFRAYATDYQLQVIGEGFTTGDIPTTKILVANVDVSPAVDIEVAQAIALWKASATISRGNTIYNQNFGAPALGDQTFQAILDVTSAGNTVGILNTPLASGFIIITHMYINLISVGDNVTGFLTPTLFLESTGIAGILDKWKYVSNLISDPGYRPDYAPLYVLQSGNFKIDATQTWRLRQDIACGGTTGFANAVFGYSTSPN